MWKKVIGPTLIVASVWIGVTAATNYFGTKAITALGRTLRSSMEAIGNTGQMESGLWELQTLIVQASKNSDGGFPFDAGAHEAEFVRRLEYAEKHAEPGEERQLVQAVRERFAQYQTATHQLLETATADATAGETSAAETLRLAVAVADPCKRLIDHHSDVVRQSVDQANRIVRALNLLRLIIFTSGPVIGVLMGFWVARTIRSWSTIHQLSVHLKDAAVGLEQEVGCIEISPTGDLPALKDQVQAVSTQITKVVRDLEQTREDMFRRERLAAAGELAAGVAHELRNPLTSLKLLIQTASQKHRGQPLSERQLQVLTDEIARMEDTIQGLLDLARPPKLRRVRHDLRDTLRRAINLVRPRAQHHGVEILEGLPSTPIKIEADPEQLHQVFINLLLNGMEAMPDGGTLRVSFGGTNDDGDCCRIKFTDTGIGIPDELMDRVFEPFVSGKEHGCGLGLAVSRRIITEHGGTLTAANRPEGGAVFTVMLPLSDKQSSGELPVLQAPSPPAGMPAVV
jgi:signal transduction histidine kinase